MLVEYEMSEAGCCVVKIMKETWRPRNAKRAHNPKFTSYNILASATVI